MSNRGRIRNAKTGRVRSLIEHIEGYLHVDLCNNDYPVTKEWVKVHRAVAHAFIDNTLEVIQGNYTGDAESRVVHHIDSDKTNNNVSNLQIVTNKENILEAHKVKRNNSRLSEDDIEEIRRRYDNRQNEPVSLKELANEYGVHTETIGRIGRRKRRELG